MLLLQQVSQVADHQAEGVSDLGAGLSRLGQQRLVGGAAVEERCPGTEALVLLAQELGGDVGHWRKLP